ncbi:MAG TPA: phage holin family protein [Bacteroidales bacterium]|nr:phage holin family protein [Bacteroidales bacterium]HSA43471.1 phage holin family protein [Bacteroidales bacterium]
MNFLIRLIVSSLAVIITSYLLPGVHIDGPLTAIIVAAVLALLNIFLKPVVVLLTIPITFFTLGLFLLVINVFMIYLVTRLVPGFTVDGFWWALAFSIILSLVTGLLDKLNEKFTF